MPFKHPAVTRTWGSRYDTLSTSPPASFAAIQDVYQRSSGGANAPFNTPTQYKGDKPPNASIFVGSLPSGVDQAELARLLTGHFSEYSAVKSIKVIRDSKGGICAFVQCEDAASASTFLQNLRSSPPKPFLGRTLRYEPAKAFRALLISYRVPLKAIMPNSTGEGPPRAVNGSSNSELPYAMRLWKLKNTKFHRIVYNAEAIEAELYFRTRSNSDIDYESEKLVYLQPLKFDSESILKLARYFGPLEKFSELTGARERAQDSSDEETVHECFPPPHNLPRGKGMSTSCWEIKWFQRDDCVAALTTLRKVPHLSVSWAHQPQFQHTERSHDPGIPLSPISNARTKPDSSPIYPSPNSTSPSELSQTDLPNEKLTQQDFIAANSDRILYKTGSVFSVGEGRNWTKSSAGPARKDPQANFAPLTITEGIEKLATTKIDWVEASFPSFPNSDCGSSTDRSVRRKVPNYERDTRPTSTVASQSAPTLQNAQDLSPAGLVDKIPPSGLTTSLPNSGMTTQQASPPIIQTCGAMSPNDETKCDSRGTSFGSIPTRDLDPTTLFVGNLEVHGSDAWTEEKVYATFGRFGGLAYVKFIQPPNGNNAFAFVKYNNTESPTQAILEEHNQVYSGRAIKVQLRDINPHRYWKHDRGRGRFPQYQASRKVMLSVRPENNVPKAKTGPVVRHSFDEKTDASKLTLPSMGATYETTECKRGKSTPNDKLPHAATGRPVVNGQPEKYREWYDTPPVGSPLASGDLSKSRCATPVLPIPAPCPTLGHYPVPWAYPYAQLGPCQIPYCGPYPGYALPAGPISPFAPPVPGPEANSCVTGSHVPWPGVVYNNYPPYFCPPPLPIAEQPLPVMQAQAPQVARAPLVPSGFIQNGQGTLIAVYPPEALNRYMAAQNNDGKRGSHPSSPMQPVNAVPVSPATYAHQEVALNHTVWSHAGINPPRLYPAQANPPWTLVPPPVTPFATVTNIIPPSGNVSGLRMGGPHDNKAEVNSPFSSPWKNQITRKDFRQENVEYMRPDRVHNENFIGSMGGPGPYHRYSPTSQNWNQRNGKH